MDEREVQAALARAAESVVGSDDLAARAERRYRMRRARGRVVSAAVVVCVIAAGLTTAALVRSNRSASPNPAELPAKLAAVDVKAFSSLAFVDADHGYGVAPTRPGQIALAKTDDGARSWRAAAVVPPETSFVAIAPRDDGLLAWGQGPVYRTTDDGAHWVATLPDADHVAASHDRVWATTRCAPGESCNNRLVMSEDGGRTWNPVSLTAQWIGAIAVPERSSTSAFAVELPDRASTTWQVAGTIDGVTWSRVATPCRAAAIPRLAVGHNVASLMLVCSTDDADLVYVSPDRGAHWTKTVPLPPQGRVASIASVSSGSFLVGKRTAVGPGWDKGPLGYPVLDQWEWKTHPQPIGDVYAFAPVPGAGVYFAASTGVYFDGDRTGQRQLRTAAPRVGPATSVHAGSVGGISFVTANVGYGVVRESGTVVRTDDGARTWVRVGELSEPGAVHFEDRSDGVGWGNGPLEFTTDGGKHWRGSDGPVDNGLAWADGRLWAMTSCVQSTPCGSRPVLISDDAGATWQPTAPLRLGFGGLTVLAVARDTAYVVEPATETQQPGSWQLARTGDGGASWIYEPLPCPQPLTSGASLAFNGRVLLLVCVGQPAGDTTPKAVFTSSDDGRTWQPAPDVPGEGADVSSFGSTFIANPGRTALLYSTDDAHSWHVAFPASSPVYTTALPGVGVWAFAKSGSTSGMWFSADGVHWQQRARSGA